MQRRSILRWGALGAAATLAQSIRAVPQGSDAGPVTRVLLVTKCHLDVGFTQTQQQVVQKYFRVYYPQAMQTAAALREAGADRYTWTTGSWLLYEYLEQASVAERRAMEQAVAAGDIAWHALPFSWQTEMLSPSMIAGSLGFSAELDRRFGKRTIGAKMTDVPGHSRGLIAPLAAAGVRMLDIGVNAASTPPDVPDIFLWQNAAGDALSVVYHRHDYGSTLRIPGTAVAVAVEVRGDNSGPHTPAEIAAIYTRLRAQFPGATVQPASLSDVAAEVDRVRGTLPVVRQEIGDTWIYGVASDPPKVARFREATRLRAEWLAQRRFATADATDRALLQRLLLGAEHTWGTDTKSYLDNDHYRPADLATVLDQPGYQTMERSWVEKRADIGDAFAALPAAMQQQAATRLAYAPALPQPQAEGMQQHDPATPIDTKHFRLAFDPATGAMVRLDSKRDGRAWANAAHPLALFTYQTLSAEEYADFLDRYIQIKADWAPRDFGKPGIERFGARAGEWHPRIAACWVAHGTGEDRIVLECAIADGAEDSTGNVAWPRQIVYDLRLPHGTPRIDLTVSTFGKLANRMPEAMWLTFHPAPDATSAPGAWSVRKLDELVAITDVVQGGGRSMHAADAAHYREPQGRSLLVDTLDAPLVSVAARSPLNFAKAQPAAASGVHFGLYNNAWGTNYVQWLGGDWRFRFRITPS